MKERPILWSAPMVLALLAGRKTQARRVVKSQPRLVRHFNEGWAGSNTVVNMFTLLKPYAEVGDRLWGRETWALDKPHVAYRADGTILTRVDNGGEWEMWHGGYVMGAAKHDKIGRWRSLASFGGKWRPSIFMPRWASRLLHEVTSVRVERLGELSEEDAIAEGIEPTTNSWNPQKVVGYVWPNGTGIYPTAREAYLAGWDSINGKGSAAKNPWVWAVSFKEAKTC